MNILHFNILLVYTYVIRTISIKAFSFCKLVILDKGA